MSLDDYAWQARQIADELLELLSPQEEAAFRQKLDADDPECWRDMSAAALQRALAFATATPAKRRATWDRTAEADRLPLWVLARAYALAFVARTRRVVGSSALTSWATASAGR